MNKLKTILKSDSGNYIHLAIATTLLLLSIQTAPAVLLFIAEMIFLWKNHRRFFYLSILLGFIIGINYYRLSTRTQHELGDQAQGMVKEVMVDKIVFVSEDKNWYVYGDNFDGLTPGDHVIIYGKNAKSGGYSIPHVFNYGAYLMGETIEGVYFATGYEIISHQFHLNQIRFTIQNYIKKVYSSEVVPVFGLLLFGDNSLLSDQTNDGIIKLGVAHIFAISGMHVGLVIVMLKAITKRLYCSNSVEHIVVVVTLLIYTFLTSFSVSMIRASVLVFLIFAGKGLKWPFSKLDYLSMILLAFLFINPFFIYQMGFQLSFLVTFSIILGNEYLSTKSELTNLLKISLLATAVGLPIILEANHEISLWGIPLSIILGLFVAKMMLPGMFLTLLIPLFEPIFLLISKGFYIIVDGIAPFNVAIPFNFPNAWLKAAYWIIILVLLVKGFTKKTIISSAMMLVIIVLLSYTINIIPNIITVTMLDVDQGDAIHLHDNRCDILIDTGKPDNFHRLADYFEAMNIRKIDMIIASHGHDDHIGELPYILTNFEVGSLIGGANTPIEKDVKHLIPNIGMKESCGSFLIEVVYYSDSDPNQNNQSIIATIQVGDDVWLFSGDAENKVEQKVSPEILKTVDVVKVSHHGSDTSSYPNYVKQFSPRYALISVGEGNYYQHPHIDVISRWLSRGAKVYRTDDLGTLRFTYYTNLGKCIVQSYRNEDYFFPYLRRNLDTYQNQNDN